MFIFGFKTVNELPSFVAGEILLLNGVLSIFASYYLRKYGYLGAVGIHFRTDMIWYPAWGAI